MSDPSGIPLRLATGAASWRSIEEETIVLDVRASVYLSFNRCASLLWNALARGTTREEMARLVLSEYDVESEQAQRDIDDFLAVCHDRGFLEA